MIKLKQLKEDIADALIGERCCPICDSVDIYRSPLMISKEAKDMGFPGIYLCQNCGERFNKPDYKEYEDGD